MFNRLIGYTAGLCVLVHDCLDFLFLLYIIFDVSSLKTFSANFPHVSHETKRGERINLKWIFSQKKQKTL